MRNNLLRNRKGFQALNYKKGNAFLDTVTILVVAILLIFFIYYSYVAYKDWNNEFQKDDDMSAEAKDMAQNFSAKYPKMFDDGFIMVIILLWIAGLVSSFFIDSHPLFFIITVVLLLFVFYAGVHLGNIYETIVTGDDALTLIVPSFPKANWFMTHLLESIIVIGLSISLVIFAKMRT